MSQRDVKQRIDSVKNIRKITSAMQMVAAARLRRAEQRIAHLRPYAGAIRRMTRQAAEAAGGEVAGNPILQEHEAERTIAILLVTGDRGLAGAYNTNIVRFAMHRFSGSAAPVQYIAVGRKGRDMLVRRGQKLLAEFSNLPAAPSFIDVSAIGRIAVDEFLEGKVDEVYLVYTDFINFVRQVPTVKKLLPLEVSETEDRVAPFAQEHRGPAAAYIYEPGQTEILDEIVPRFTALQVYQAVLESLASEHAARMVAMKNATDSANALGSALQLEYNKARQQSITNEMLDIAGGVEALSKG